MTLTPSSHFLRPEFPEVLPRLIHVSRANSDAWIIPKLFTSGLTLCNRLITNKLTEGSGGDI